MAATERWYSLQEIARHLGASDDTIHRWIRLNGMPAHKVGKLWKFKLAQVDKWIESGKASPPIKEQE